MSVSALSRSWREDRMRWREDRTGHTFRPPAYRPGCSLLQRSFPFSSISAHSWKSCRRVRLNHPHVETLVQPRGLSPALLSPAPKHATRLCPKRISQSSRAAVGFGVYIQKYRILIFVSFVLFLQVSVEYFSMIKSFIEKLG